MGASCYSYEKKHPILLHASHRLTKLYFERQNVNSMHAGPQLRIATVMETIWPVKGRNLATRTVSNCAMCRRVRGQTLQPKMGNRPPEWRNSGYPYLSVGLDFAGSFFIVNRKIMEAVF